MEQTKKYVCDICGNPTDNIYKWTSKVTGKRFTHYTCDDCKRADAIEDWQNEQGYEETMICPWCDYHFTSDENIYDEYITECYCPVCGKIIEFKVDKVVLWTTRKPKRLYDETQL